MRFSVFSDKIHSFLQEPGMPLAKWSPQSAGRLLHAKMHEVSAESSKAFASFVASACMLRGTSVGHCLVKTAIKHKTLHHLPVQNVDEKACGVAMA